MPPEERDKAYLWDMLDAALAARITSWHLLEKWLQRDTIRILTKRLACDVDDLARIYHGSDIYLRLDYEGNLHVLHF